MLDPDAPTPEQPTSKSNRHFIGCNYYQTWGDHVLRNTTQPPSRWYRPLPLPNSREHRYVFLVYSQPKSFDWTIIYERSTHEHFDIAAYAEQNKLGNPIAGNFFWIESNASCWREGWI
ncbi:phosphatidylethanolamine-binding protein [Panaeolus papilionaceus]|nr:phosphatidylethanolamine-binding protein [Panaeolus papilionaceus]